METTALVKAFETELNLNEQGFKDLIERKKGLVIDVKTKDGFKLARKERTEQNGIVKDIDRLAIDGKNAVDLVRSELKEKVIKIFAPIVTAFEAEDLRQKEAKKEAERKEAERIQIMRDQINSISNFSSNLIGKTSEELQGVIEAVDMIDVSENFAELTQEAIAVKKETLNILGASLNSAILNEQLIVEREQLRKEREESEIKIKAQERLNTLIMIPSGFFGKASGEIDEKIHSLSNHEVKKEEFGELFHQANASKDQVIRQLNIMLDQQLTVEKAQKEESERIAQIKANDAELKKREQDEKLVEQTELSNKDKFMKQLSLWKSKYKISETEFRDLMSIVNQYI